MIKIEDNKLKIQMVKTDTICFISDCFVTSGYNYDYHRTQLDKIYFDGVNPKNTYYKNWLQIEKYPTKIERLVKGKRINQRYEINDKEMISKKLPEIISYNDKQNYSEEILDSLYTYKYDAAPDRLEEIDVDIEVILEVDNFKLPPNMNYKAIHRWNYSDTPYQITNANVQHQLLDRMIFPEIMLHSRPCSLSSKQMYDITRQYIRDNIDGSKAKITSDYDFCFEVKKSIPLIEPETISYQNVFGRTKREREKIHFKTIKTKDVQIYQMTNDQENYRGYTAIKPMYGENEEDLKNKVDEWLKTLIGRINKPLELCPHCRGTGYMDEIAQKKG